ncbi:MAG: FAD-binding protein [Candidatus Delongbacteria bacterium]|nr:FAD-binding protein [Candidatus Delongbacteria bacterium]MBN2836954.1 FAD-binding protein [Candidatus Delongbacteria bacterium]
MCFDELLDTLGEDKCLLSIEERFVNRTDTTKIEGLPDCVVYANTKEDIIKTVLFSRKNNIPVIARGAGSGMSGGVCSHRGGIIICFEKMDKILNFKPLLRTMLVEPGVITSDIYKLASEKNLYYPPDPSSFTVSTIGGNVAENAGGLHCVKYGVTSKYVKGLRYIDNEGNDCSAGSLSKNYNPLASMMNGSEGTFGFIYEIELSLIPKPSFDKLFLLHLKSFEEAVKIVHKIKNTGISVSMMEIIDESAFEAVINYKKIDVPDFTKSLLLVEVDGFSFIDMLKRSEGLEKLLNEESVSFSASSEKETKDELSLVRRSISPAIRNLSPNKMNEDIVIPINRFKDIISIIRKISSETGIRIPIYGHAGDGNLHVNILYDKNDVILTEKAVRVAEAIFSQTIKLGGSISGEHGIGLAKKRFLGIQYGNNEMETFKKIKKSFDPDNLINPEKII